MAFAANTYILFSYCWPGVSDPAHDWGNHTSGHLGLGHDVNALRGKVLGGGLAVNAAVAMRARAADFESWTRKGIKGWTFDDDGLKRSYLCRIWGSMKCLKAHGLFWAGHGLEDSE